MYVVCVVCVCVVFWFVVCFCGVCVCVWCLWCVVCVCGVCVCVWCVWCLWCAGQEQLQYNFILIIYAQFGVVINSFTLFSLRRLKFHRKDQNRVWLLKV